MLPLLARLTWRSVALPVVEHALVVLAVLVAAGIRLGLPLDEGLPAWAWVWRASLIAGVLQLCLHYCDLYDFRTLRDRGELAVGLMQAVGAASIILALIYYWLPDLIIGRGVFLISVALIFGLVAGWRILFEWLSARVGPAERILILGSSPAALELAREIFERRHELGVEIVGFIDADATRVGAPVLNPRVVGTIEDIPAAVREHNVDRVVVSLADTRGKLSMDKLLDIKLNDGVRFDHLASAYEQYTGKIAVENLRPSWFVFSEGFHKTQWATVVKRLIDIALAFVGLIATAPIMALTALAIRLTSPGPALYHQSRVGQHGRVFRLHKFRSMRVDAEAATGAVWSHKNDPRVTRVGRLLRRMRLDELPQLWNVLRGEMSCVGPRPERPEFIRDLTERIPFYGQRHVVRPGVTGWAQVRYAYGASVRDALEKLQYDLYYVKHVSLSLDIYIMFETMKIVALRRGL